MICYLLLVFAYKISAEYFCILNIWNSNYTFINETKTKKNPNYCVKVMLFLNISRIGNGFIQHWYWKIQILKFVFLIIAAYVKNINASGNFPQIQLTGCYQVVLVIISVLVGVFLCVCIWRWTRDNKTRIQANQVWRQNGIPHPVEQMSQSGT